MRTKRQLLSGGRISRRGATLIELIGCLMILAGVALVITELFKLTFATVRETHIRNELISRADTAMGYLRRDVWSANAVRAHGTTLELETPEGLITWRVEGSDWIRNGPGADRPAMKWAAMPAMEFAAGAHAELVDVTVLAADQVSAPKKEKVTLMSQRLLAGGLK